MLVGMRRICQAVCLYELLSLFRLHFVVGGPGQNERSLKPRIDRESVRVRPEVVAFTLYQPRRALQALLHLLSRYAVWPTYALNSKVLPRLEMAY